MPAAASSMHDPAPMIAWMKRSIAALSPNRLVNDGKEIRVERRLVEDARAAAEPVAVGDLERPLMVGGGIADPEGVERRVGDLR